MTSARADATSPDCRAENKAFPLIVRSNITHYTGAPVCNIFITYEGSVSDLTNVINTLYGVCGCMYGRVFGCFLFYLFFNKWSAL